MRTLTLGYSPCPNDTFIFYGLVKGKIASGDLNFKEVLLDVEALNKAATEERLDVTKVSYSAFCALRDRYCLLRSGGALGRGCGPLIVSQTGDGNLRGKKIAIPGELTTAYLLLRLFDPSLTDIVPMRFDLIMDSVLKGETDAGLIIHESRFTYQSLGLVKVVDLGEWWENETGLPIPLGAIIAKRSLGGGVIREAEALIRQSVLYALNHGDEPMDYIKAHAQELSDDVISKHIALYVNEFTLDLGQEGEKAVRELFKMAEDRGVMAKSTLPIFAD